MTYNFTLIDKQGFEIDTTKIHNCINRIEAITRAKNLMLSQGLKTSKYKFSLKKLTN